ncbi:C39 family peptidase [Lentilactobacillus otakiensis]|uniref:SH3 domain-containing protein n=1 Tax=Lentilactobacillus otakiensis DSM 19908 = JCM 15040 TaxID=1423780 RepID=S4NUD6_9LACO|nr:C39 family peptidase [Lentilactobacillus otakiensis]KRL09948.1 SH3 domain-containing protein [Lentilactobacillus otakiensis DSM 19908 = JCM 15040]MBZ3776280.1 C39 family peptidase [Lentilactobacillus otakiensis]MDV3517296.1 C39 family peptidase [Lentilactobacillus otakiensis]GAD17573.1 SH3 domain-containing protein [Lentilactobacillus otakiensis DSM 19908 = JCM 15040]
MHPIRLSVNLIEQRPELPTGCEITAVTMMLQYAGNHVNKVALAHEMPYNPTDWNKGFVGDPFTENGDSIYPPALLELVTQYAGNAVDFSGYSIGQLEQYLSDTGHPIVVWVGKFDGFSTHALVMTGFDDQVIYYNDCWTGEQTSMPIAEFEQIRSNKMKLALSY